MTSCQPSEPGRADERAGEGALSTQHLQGGGGEGPWVNPSPHFLKPGHSRCYSVTLEKELSFLLQAVGALGTRTVSHYRRAYKYII